jgi:sarcosine oxidase, subunit beta
VIVIGAGIHGCSTALHLARRGAKVIVLEGCAVRHLERQGGRWEVLTDAGLFRAPKVVNAAGAWAGRIAALVGEHAPVEVIAPMLMITSRVAHFIEPVVILASRKLSFKQFPNGTVLIGGGHRGRADTNTNETVLD